MNGSELKCGSTGCQDQWSRSHLPVGHRIGMFDDQQNNPRKTEIANLLTDFPAVACLQEEAVESRGTVFC